MNFVDYRLLGDENEPIPDVDRIGVVVVGALPVVRAVAAEDFVLFTNGLINAN
jgi:hypothetical protein